MSRFAFLQERIHERVVGQLVDFLVPQIQEVGAHLSAYRRVERRCYSSDFVVEGLVSQERMQQPTTEPHVEEVVCFHT